MAAAAAMAVASPLSLTGQMSEADFQAAASLFCEWWAAAHPDQPPWVMQSVHVPVTQQVVQYMQLERPVTAGGPAAPTLSVDSEKPAAESGGSRSACDAGCSGLDAEPLGRAQQQQQQQRKECHVHKYSVVWHAIYRVPVLYITASRTDGCPLMLSELMADLVQLVHYQDEGQAGWTYITATAHPMTGAPCHMLHPCQTATRMQLMMHSRLTEQQHTPHTKDLPCAAPAAEVAGVACPPNTLPAGAANAGAANAHSRADELLAYAQGWFSMVAPLLGVSLLAAS